MGEAAIRTPAAGPIATLISREVDSSGDIRLSLKTLLCVRVHGTLRLGKMSRLGDFHL
jgi:hypothetical protein